MFLTTYFGIITLTILCLHLPCHLDKINRFTNVTSNNSFHKLDMYLGEVFWYDAYNLLWSQIWMMTFCVFYISSYRFKPLTTNIS